MIHDKEKRQFISIGTASNITGIGIQTLRKMADTKVLSCYKTSSGTRMFCKNSVQNFCSNFNVIKETGKNTKINFLYTRVSTKKQLDDLSRQVEYIKRPQYVNYTLIKDIGSGINFKRKGLQEILDACLQGVIGEVVVSHKDRLSRFAFDLIELFITKAGGKITLLDIPENKSSEQELADDLLSIVHIFSCRQMGKRSYKKPTCISNTPGSSLSHETTSQNV
jgi:predicted site-specific integrase-resolvase